MNMNTMPLEAETRILIDRNLEHLGWKLSGKDQNVFYERQSQKMRRKSSVANAQTMFFTLKKAIDRLLLLKQKRKVLA